MKSNLTPSPYLSTPEGLAFLRWQRIHLWLKRKLSTSEARRYGLARYYARKAGAGEDLNCCHNWSLPNSQGETVLKGDKLEFARKADALAKDYSSSRKAERLSALAWQRYCQPARSTQLELVA